MQNNDLSSLVVFWNCACECDTPISLPQYDFRQFHELVIAEWFGLSAKVTRKIIHYDNGNISEVTKPMISPDGLVSSYWDVECDADNPYFLAQKIATSFPEHSIPRTILRGGEISTW